MSSSIPSSNLNGRGHGNHSDTHLIHCTPRRYGSSSSLLFHGRSSPRPCVRYSVRRTCYSTQNLPLTGQSFSQRYAFYDYIPLLSKGNLKNPLHRNQFVGQHNTVTGELWRLLMINYQSQDTYPIPLPRRSLVVRYAGYDHILYAITWACASNPGSMNGRALNG